LIYFKVLLREGIRERKAIRRTFLKEEMSPLVLRPITVVQKTLVLTVVGKYEYLTIQ